MQAGPVLRDRSLNTRLLILSEMLREPGVSLSEVARRLGITVQAISNHAQALLRDGALAQEHRSYRVTAVGVDRLQSGVDRLVDAVSQLRRPLQRVASASAVAAGALRSGQQVGLVMEGGELMAYPDSDAASQGVVREGAKAGQEVIVERLEGVVSLTPGRLTVLVLPGPAEGGGRVADLDALAAIVAELDVARVAAVGTGARAAARQVGRLDDPFAGTDAAFAAAEHGLDVVLLCSRDRWAEAMERLETRNGRTLARIQVDVRDAPRRR